MDAPIDIYLASQSPRRRELLAQINVRFSLLDVDVDEAWRDGEPPADYVERVAREKAQAGLVKRTATSARPVLGADTAVVCGGEIFGKPRDREHALSMLQQLSGRSHEVMTAVALVDRNRAASLVQISTVTMSDLTSAMLEAYWASGEPVGKAGAYAIQGLAAGFVSRLEGSFSGVKGLPLFETLQLMREFGMSGFQQQHDYLLGDATSSGSEPIAGSVPGSVQGNVQGNGPGSLGGASR